MGEHQQDESFGRDIGEVVRARRFVAAALGSWGLEAEAPALGLVAIELVGNAVLHGRGEIHLGLRHEDGRLRLEVTDEGGGPSSPRLQVPSERGWGLHLVDQLADEWGTERRATGTLVWMVRRIRHPPTPPGFDEPDPV
jgi:anti-sigma regulatory factor (Ser/Thr protein kinase)